MNVDLKEKYFWIKKRIEYLNYKNYLPINHSVEDIYLVSYPKSGNTWIRFLLANAFKLHFEIDRDVNFFSILEIIPDIHLSRNIDNRGIFGKSNFPRIIKSHAAYNPHYHRVLLLARDPRDVLVSYYNYAKNRNMLDADWDLSKFIRSRKFGADKWAKHTYSWYSYFKQGQTIQFFLYEELLAQPELQLGKIMELFGFNMPQKLLSQAVELSSKKAMKFSEEKHRSTSIIDASDKSFVRTSNSGHKDKLCDRDLKYIENTTRYAAELIGYKF